MAAPPSPSLPSALRLSLALWLCVACAAESGGRVPLARFDGLAHRLDHLWVEQNDPVMGGRSSGGCAVNQSNASLVFYGEVRIVPALKAPGFIHCSSSPRLLGHTFPDVSGCTGIAITLRSTTDYDGFRLSFGNAHPKGGKFFAYGYKATLDVKASSKFSEVEIPFKEFTDFWDDATGEPIKSCTAYPEYCPDATTLHDIRTLSIWAEGKLGTVALEVTAIDGYGCAAQELVAVA